MRLRPQSRFLFAAAVLGVVTLMTLGMNVAITYAASRAGLVWSPDVGGWSVIIGVLMIGAALLCWLIDRWVVRGVVGRLRVLSGDLVHIRRSGDVSQRLPVDGVDEIATLAIETNRLLSSMEQSQRALERANAEMQHRVADRTAALAAANAALEADIAQRTKAEQEREQLRAQLMRAHRMEAVGTLAGGIAHDFNNILTGILGHAQLLATEPKAPEEVRQPVRQIVAAAERAASLVKQILAFSRQTPGERRSVAVGQVAREAMALLRAALPAGIAMRCVATEGADWVEADPTQLHQVFMNLGTNAGHAMAPRGGTLEIRIENTTRLPGLIQLPPGEYVEVSVTDTGCGMSPEVLERIFDPFFSTKPVNQGTGLGLSVVHGIIAEHGGAIDVDSTPGQGSCFRFWLPASRPKLVNLDAMERPRLSTRGHERILLVDDEELVLSVVAKGLQQMGYAVTALTGPMQALETFERMPDHFDLIITDQTMPVMSGIELTAEVKRIRPSTPVILVTGYSPDLSGKTPAELGLFGVMGKPLRFEQLGELIRRAAAAVY